MERKAANRQAAELGRTLKTYRRERGVTRSSLARMAGVTEGTIRAIEEGRTKAPSLWVVMALARGLGVLASELVPQLEMIAEIIVDDPKHPGESFMPGEVVLLLDEGKIPRGCVYRSRRLTVRGQILNVNRGRVLVTSAQVTVDERPRWD